MKESLVGLYLNLGSNGNVNTVTALVGMSSPIFTTVELAAVTKNPLCESVSSPSTAEGDLKILEELENENADRMKREFIKTCMCALLLTVSGMVRHNIIM
jgi:hypothetical protein